jgi:endonuclease/exonuclease/phosphatase family metal-dependent hydrolase
MTKKILGTSAFFICTILIFFIWGSSGWVGKENYLIMKDYGQLEGREKDTFSIITYNIGYASGMENNLAVKPTYDFYQNNLNTAIKLFSEANTDFIAFQEVDFESNRSYNQQQLDSIGYQCGYAFGSQATNWDKRYLPFPYWPLSVQYGKIHSGQALLSKYKIIQHQRNVLSKPDNNPSWYNAMYIDRLVHAALVDLGKRKMYIVNVHLEAFSAETRVQHVLKALDIVDSLHQIAPVLFVGDFNAEVPFTPQPLYDSVALEPMFNSESIMWALDQSVFLQSPEKYHTFPSENAVKKIDHIFVSRDKIVPIKYEVLTEFGEISDHLPVKLTFTFTKK